MRPKPTPFRMAADEEEEGGLGFGGVKLRPQRGNAKGLLPREEEAEGKDGESEKGERPVGNVPKMESTRDCGSLCGLFDRNEQRARRRQGEVDVVCILRYRRGVCLFSLLFVIAMP